MSKYGTAPIRIAPGHFVYAHGPRKGQSLTAVGNAYWEHHYQLGLVDAQGHVNKSRVADYLDTQRLANELTNPRKAARLGKQEMKALGPGNIFGTAAYAAHGGLLHRTIGELGLAAVNTPAGLVAAAEHPVRAAKAIPKQVLSEIQHPLRHPGFTLLDAFTAASLGAGGIARLSNLSRTGSLAAPIESGAYKTGDLTVSRPLSRNALARVVQKRRIAAVNKRLAGEQPAVPLRTPHLNDYGVVGREVRANRRVAQDIHMAPFVEHQHAIKGLSRGEHAAINVIATSGQEAIDHPLETLNRHIAVHEQNIQHLEQELASAKPKEAPGLHQAIKDNQAYIRDLKLAEPALTAPSEKFLNAVEQTRSLSKKAEQELISRGHLKAEVAKGRMNKIAAVYGHSEAPAGSFFYSLRDLPLKKAKGGYSTPSLPETGVGKPGVGRYVSGLKKPFTGASVKKARIPFASESVAHRFARVTRLAGVEDFYGLLRQAAHDVRQSKNDVPIRDTAAVNYQLKDFFRKLHDQIDASPDEAAHLDPSEVESLKNLLEASEHRSAGVGTKVKGVKWVDKNLIKDLGDTSVSGPLLKTLDAINNPIRFTSLYLRPAYALNFAQNAAMMGITNGHRMPVAVWKASRARKTLGDDVVATLDSAVGNGKALAQQVDQGFMGHAVRSIAGGWNTVTDLLFRRAIILDELAKRGIKSPAEIRDFVHSQHHREAFIQAARVARKDAVDYDSMTPVEKNAIRRIIYFYPWVSRATQWTGRTVVEHPVKANVFQQIGLYGRQQNANRFGPLPEWAKWSGLIPIGKNKVINPSALWTASTPVQTLTGRPQDVLTPAVATAVKEANTNFGKAALDFPINLMTGTPQAAAATRSGAFGRHSKTFPSRSLAETYGPLLAGGAFPKTMDKEVAREGAMKERKGRAGFYARVDDLVKRGWMDQAEADKAKAWAKTAKKSKIGQANSYLERNYYGFDRFQSEVNQLVDAGKMPRADGDKAIAWAKKANPSAVAKAITYLHKNY